METRLSAHGAYRTEYHIVWIPKYRRRILNPSVRGYLSKHFPKVIRNLAGCEIIEHSIMVDHVYLVMLIPPRYAVSHVVGRMKQFTARGLREKFAWLEKAYWKERLAWSSGYFVSTIRLDEKKILAYLAWQQRQDSGQAKLKLF